MGIYLNPGSGKFEEALNSEIYVDKSGLIAYTNKVFGTKQKYVLIALIFLIILRFLEMHLMRSIEISMTSLRLIYRSS